MHQNYIRNFTHKFSNFISFNKIITYTVNSFMDNLKMLLVCEYNSNMLLISMQGSVSLYSKGTS